MGTFNDTGDLTSEVGHHHAESDKSCADAHINEREMWVVVSATHRWKHLWQDHSVVFVPDNTKVQAALATGRCVNKLIMRWVKELFWLSIDFNFDIKSPYVKSRENVICDALSRWHAISSRSRIAAVDPDGFLGCSHLFK